MVVNEAQLEPGVAVNSFECRVCSVTFNKRFNLNKHIKNVHSEKERKPMHHIKKNKKVVCPVCDKEYTHSASLKDHIIKKH